MEGGMKKAVRKEDEAVEERLRSIATTEAS